MRRFLAVTLLCLLASSGLGQDKVNIQLQQSGPKPGDVAAYKIGHDMGVQLHQGGLEAGDLTSADFLAGFTDALNASRLLSALARTDGLSLRQTSVQHPSVTSAVDPSVPDERVLPVSKPSLFAG